MVQGCKNSVLPIMAASLLHEGTSVIDNCPDISDVHDMSDILEQLGCKVSFKGKRLVIDAAKVNGGSISSDTIKNVRASILIMGALVARCGYARVQYPGGCKIGKRPVDYHIYALEKLGVHIIQNENTIECDGHNLKGSNIVMPFPSVGATQNAILAAVAAEGTTLIYGGAEEPEVHEMCIFLRKLGADISDFRRGKIIVRGRMPFKDAWHVLHSDRIVSGTYACAACITGGSVSLGLNNTRGVSGLTGIFTDMGCKVVMGNDYFKIESKEVIHPVKKLVTAPYPGFPTDMQSQIMAVLSLAKGKSLIEEKIFETRYQTVPELRKMGADIEIADGKAYINGVNKLNGTTVTAKELRGGASLIIAALNAEGQTIVEDYGEYIMRGYEKIADNIRQLGGNIDCV